MITFGLLVALALIGIASVQTSITQMRIASNSEENGNAFQVAQSALTYIISNPSNLPTTGPLNTATTVSLPASISSFSVATGETLSGTAMRVADCAPPPRVRAGSSLNTFSAFKYRVESDVDKTATGRGKSSQRLGYLLLGPKC